MKPANSLGSVNVAAIWKAQLNMSNMSHAEQEIWKSQPPLSPGNFMTSSLMSIPYSRSPPSLKFQNFNGVIPRAGNSRKMQEQWIFSANKMISVLINIPHFSEKVQDCVAASSILSLTNTNKPDATAIVPAQIHWVYFDIGAEVFKSKNN